LSYSHRNRKPSMVLAGAWVGQRCGAFRNRQVVWIQPPRTPRAPRNTGRFTTKQTKDTQSENALCCSFSSLCRASSVSW